MDDPYRSKEDVLASYVEELFAQFGDSLSHDGPTDAYQLALCYFEFWRRRLDVIELLNRQGLLSMLLERYEEVARMYRKWLSAA